MFPGNFYRFVRLKAVLAIGFIANSAFAINLQLGDILVFNEPQKIATSVGVVKENVYYKVTGLNLGPSDAAVITTIEEFYTLTDKTELAKLKVNFAPTTIVIRNVDDVKQLDGVLEHQRAHNDK